MLKTRQLRGHRRDLRTVTELEYLFQPSEIAAAHGVGVASEMVGQYVFERRAVGQMGPGEVRLEGFETTATGYRLWGTHRA